MGERQELRSQVLYEGAAFPPSSEESSRYWFFAIVFFRYVFSQSANAELSQQILSTYHVQALGPFRLLFELPRHCLTGIRQRSVLERPALLPVVARKALAG